MDNDQQRIGESGIGDQRAELAELKTPTPVQTIALKLIEQSMGQSAYRIGLEIYNERGDSGGSNLTAIGGTTCGQLRRLGYVMHLHNEGLWRITSRGRAALTAALAKAEPK